MTEKARKIIAWQPVLTDHQAFTLEALAAQAHAEALAYVAVMEDAERKRQGWTDTQVRAIQRRQIPAQGFLKYCFRELRSTRGDIHLFGSPFQQPRLMLCMLYAACLGVEFYLISEPYSPQPDGYLRESFWLAGRLKAALRPWMYRSYVLALRSRLSGVFAISALAVRQYEKAGMPVGKIFPFGYFIPRSDLPPLAASSTASNAAVVLRVVFVGTLIRRKGLDLLIAAVNMLAAQGVAVHLDIYGPGDAETLPGGHAGHSDISYRGVIPFGDTQKVVRGYDVLVLPSRYDGWGVVVNESICAGVPVVCSDQVGAGLVAADLGAGLTFPSEDAVALRNVLERLATTPALLQSLRDGARAAAPILQPDTAARYMRSVLRAPTVGKSKVPNPWYPR